MGSKKRANAMLTRRIKPKPGFCVIARCRKAGKVALKLEIKHLKKRFSDIHLGKYCAKHAEFEMRLWDVFKKKAGLK